MLLLYNGKIYNHPKNVDSVVIKNDKIIYIGNLLNIPKGKYEKKINLKNKLLLPSFIDTHTHFSEYLKLKQQINFSKAETMEDIMELVEKNPQKTKGYGLKISLFDKETLHKLFKNIKRENSLTIASSDYHTYLTTQIGLTDRPVKTENTDIKIDKESITRLYKYGITSIHEMAFDKSAFEFYNTKIKDKIEVIRYFPASMSEDVFKTGIKDTEYIRTLGIKLFYDGSIGSNTAFLFKFPKSYENHEKILKEVEEQTLKSLNNGFSVAIHAIGDKAVDDIVNLYQKHIGLIKNTVRIEHAQTITDNTIKKLEIIKEKVHLSMQPLHIRDDIELIKANKIQNLSFRFKSLENITTGFSSDVPVVEFNPFKAIYYAVNNPVNPKEKITVKQAIDNYTLNAAKLSGEENLKGSIDLNKYANLIVTDDYTEKNPDFWLKAQSFLTILRGRIVWQNI